MTVKKDAKEIARLTQKYFGNDYKPFRFTKKIIEEKMSQKKNKFFVATENKKIIGVLRTEIEDIDLANLRWLAVDEKFQKRDVGKDLTAHALEFLRRQKFRKLIARVKASNKAALSLFKSFGFKQEGYFKNHFRKGTDIVQLSKFLL